MKTNQAILNGLIGACLDDIHAQRTAARIVAGAKRRGALEDSADRRASFVVELTELVRAEGGSPRDDASVGETLRGAFRSVRALVIGDNTGDAYAWCELVEQKTLDRYDHARDGSLSAAARELVERHRAEIFTDHASLRLQRSGGR